MQVSANDVAPTQTLATVVGLLHDAAERQWRQAEQEGPRSPRHSAGLAACLAGCQAANLLPSDVEVRDAAADERSALELLRSAEELTRTLPVTHDFLGLSHLVVAIGEVLREAQALDS